MGGVGVFFEKKSIEQTDVYRAKLNKTAKRKERKGNGKERSRGYRSSQAKK